MRRKLSKLFQRTGMISVEVLGSPVIGAATPSGFADEGLKGRDTGTNNNVCLARKIPHHLPPLHVGRS